MLVIEPGTQGLSRVGTPICLEQPGILVEIAMEIAGQGLDEVSGLDESLPFIGICDGRKRRVGTIKRRARCHNQWFAENLIIIIAK